MKYFSRFGIKEKYDSKNFQYATHTVDGKKIISLSMVSFHLSGCMQEQYNNLYKL